MSTPPSLEEVTSFFEQAFAGADGPPEIIRMEDGEATIRLKVKDTNLRPGGYVSGPTQMSMADTVTYIAIFSRIGITPMAVTTSLNMSFLRPLICDTVIADCKLIKLGRTLAVAEVDIRGQGSNSAASHAVVTYALPRE